MSHPYEQLADLMDGALDAHELAEVRAHLDSCATCRQDVDLATRGVRAARSLPVESPPPDLHRRVVRAGGGHGAPAWYRWAGAAAAAAAVIAIAIALPNVGNDPRGGEISSLSGQDSRASVESGPVGGDVVVSEEDRDYDAPGLVELARSATASSELAPNAAGGTGQDATAAAGCVSQAIGDQQAGRLIRLIQARFEGEAAYIAVYLEGPGAGEPPDTVAVWAASADDCSVLSFASARI
jgi:hypothetical protein